MQKIENLQLQLFVQHDSARDLCVIQTQSMNGDKHKVIIDTDPGVDDAMAIFLALGSPNIVVEGFTIVHGNR